MTSTLTPEHSINLAKKYPDAVEAMYEACSDGALRHTGGSSPFEHLPTDLEAYPLQDVNVQLAPATPQPISAALGIGELLSTDFTERTTAFIAENKAAIAGVHEALDEGYNVAVAVPTHSQVHDIALPFGQIAVGLWQDFGLDDASNRYLIFAKALNWYGYLGLPVPDVARTVGNVAFSLPHSKSGDHFDSALQNDFNKEALRQMHAGLAAGGKLIGFATGGSTNNKIVELFGHTIAESQGAIHPGTARLMTAENILVLPTACYIDRDTRLQTRLGPLAKLETDQDCLNVGIWAAEQYSEMSGLHTLQARTRAQHERFAKTKVQDLRNVLARGIGFVTHFTQREESSE